MANGDIGRNHGFEPVSVNADFRNGYDDINRLADWAGSTTEVGASAIQWNSYYGQWSDKQPAGDQNQTVVRRSRFGVCQLTMNVVVPTTGAAPGSALFWMPEGYRPGMICYFNAWLYNSQAGLGFQTGPCVCSISPDGKVTFISGIGGNVPGNGGGIFGSVSYGTVW